MKSYIPLVMVLLGFLLLWTRDQQHNSVAALAGSPSIEYLGEGGSFTVDAGRHFIVKRVNPFRFVNEPGPTYDAAPGERVWAGTVGAPAAIRETWIRFGNLPEDCKVSYTAIDDDPDDRLNTFYVDGEEIHTMPL